MMNDPRDHHYIPVFYLKRWTNAKAKLIEYSRPRGRLVPKEVGPRATGFQKDLYTFPDLPTASRQVLEREFFSGTDQLASYAMQQLYAGNVTWTPELRTAWSRFVLNFRIRHPDPLKELRDHIRATWNRSDALYEARYAKIRKPEHPATLVEYTSSLGKEAGEKIQLRLLQSLLDNERIGQQINEMQWDVLDLSNANHALVTSDWPCDLLLAHGVISLPIGPHLLFVAAKDASTLRRMHAAKHNRISEITNRFVVAKARKYVYAQDQSQTLFVEKYMSKDMLKSPLWPSLGATHASELSKTALPEG